MNNEIHKCTNCQDEGWVCEKHPNKPWRGGKGCCGGAGMPCVCNKSDPPWAFGFDGKEMN
jgi:hypothetical protein